MTDNTLYRDYSVYLDRGLSDDDFDNGAVLEEPCHGYWLGSYMPASIDVNRLIPGLNVVFDQDPVATSIFRPQGRITCTEKKQMSTFEKMCQKY